MGIFLLIGNIFPSKAIAPTWSYKIKNIADFAMSKNGEYLIVACEKGPGCEEGKFYIFDRYGNTLKDDCINSEITAVDIANNGTFFLGAPDEYYFSSVSRKMEGTPIFVSMSKNGETVVTGTKKEIFIYDRQGEKDRKSISDEGEVTALAVSDDGGTIVCGLSNGVIWILDSQLTIQETVATKGNVRSIAMTADESHLIYGTQEGRVFYLDSSGNQIWSYPEESSEEKIVQDVAISFDGSLVAVLSENIAQLDSSILLLDFSGKELQKIESPETIQHIHLSQFGEILSYSLHDELIFLELYQHGYVEPYEYMLPSKIESESTSLERVQQYETDSLYKSDSPPQPQSAIVADINGDGQKEIICSFPKEVVIFNLEGEKLWKIEKELQKDGSTFEFEIAAMDLNFDFIPEIIVTSKDNYMKFLVFDGNGEKLASHNLYSRWYVEPPSEDLYIKIYPLWSGDIDNDGLIEVVCRVSAGHVLEPRGIYVFEYPSFKEEWYYPCAPNVATVNIVDLDNDGNLEIVWGSDAPCDHRKVENTDDCHTYVFAINLQGEELWVKEIESVSKKVNIAVADLDQNGTNEVVCGGRSLDDNWGELFALDAQGNYLNGISLDHPIYLKGVSDLDSDGYMEMLVSDTEKALAVYNHNFGQEEKNNVSISGSLGITINDLDGDGHKEIIVISNDNTIVVLDSSLKEEWNESFSGSIHKVMVVNLSQCKNDLLVLADKLYLYSYEGQSNQPCTLPPPMRSLEMEIQDHITKGKDHYNKREYEEAIREYELAIDKSNQVGNVELLSEAAANREEAVNEYNLELEEARKHFEEGKNSKELEDYQKAAEDLLKAKEIYKRLGFSDKVQEIDDMLIEIAAKLLEESEYYKELKDYQRMKEALSHAKDIYDSRGESGKVQLLSAQESIVEGDEKESQENYEEAIPCYKEAFQIYEGLNMIEEMEMVQLMLEQVQERAKEYAITRINKVIIGIAFVISFAVVTLFYLRRKGYRGENKRTNTIYYGITIISLCGVFMISLSALSFPLGNATYILTCFMCLFFFMILRAYSRGS